MAGGDEQTSSSRKDPADTVSDEKDASVLGYTTPTILKGRPSAHIVDRDSNDATRPKCPLSSDLRALDQDMAPRSASRVQDLIKKLEQQERKHDRPLEPSYVGVRPPSRISSAGSKASFRTSDSGDDKTQQKVDEDSGIDVSKTYGTEVSVEIEQKARVLTPRGDSLTDTHSSVSRPSPTSPISPFFEKDDLGFLEQQSYFAQPRLGHRICKPDPEAVTVFKRIVIEKRTIDMQKEYSPKVEGKGQVNVLPQEGSDDNATETDLRPLSKATSGTTVEGNKEPPNYPKTPTRIPQFTAGVRRLPTLASKEHTNSPMWKEMESAQVAEPSQIEPDSPILKYLTLGVDYQPRSYSVNGDERANENEKKKESNQDDGNDESRFRSIPTTNISSLDVYMRRDLMPASKVVPDPTFRDTPAANMWRDVRSYLWANVETENPHCPEPASAPWCEELEEMAVGADLRLGDSGRPAPGQISGGAPGDARYPHQHSKAFFEGAPRRRTVVEIDAYVESVSSVVRDESEGPHARESRGLK